ncbi:unnamed protein product [Cylicocyclus nassatus]|uniref:G-protein coupled receptors family 1 profile domain-containing protein n=1 Tax=Cylicocyclus nassatus TaxID=53992 RepID=A0AA36MBE2_CYLNA|nr:unnamed protein product [Cylicocyclus nassatus]
MDPASSTENVYKPCLSSLQVLLWQKWASDSVVHELVSKTRTDVYTRGLSVAGIMNVSDVLVRCTLILYILPWIPIVITINVLKNKMYALVRSRENVFSAETLRLHGNLIKALTTQSLTPLLHLITYICYVVEQHIFPNIATELLMFMPIGILSIVTPIINIYYIRPYREQFIQCLGFRAKVIEQRSSKASLGNR